MPAVIARSSPLRTARSNRPDTVSVVTEVDVQEVRLACRAMATRFEIAVYGDEVPRLQAAAEEALREIVRLEGELSAFRQTSAIGRINARASIEPVRVSPEVFGLLQRVQQFVTLTDGAFDVTVGPLLEAWGFRGPMTTQPGDDDLMRVLERVGMDHVHLDVERRSVAFDCDGVRIDLGGIGKGYALDVARNALMDAGVDCALMHGGASTIIAIGSDPQGGPWRIGVKGSDPHIGEAFTHVVELEDEAMSVSAITGRMIESADGRFGHVIDPRSGYAVHAAEIAVAVTPDATDADALSTALVVLGAPGIELLERRVVGLRGLVGKSEISEQ